MNMKAYKRDMDYTDRVKAALQEGDAERTRRIEERDRRSAEAMREISLAFQSATQTQGATQ